MTSGHKEISPEIWKWLSAYSLSRPLQTSFNKVWVLKFSSATNNAERRNFPHQYHKCPSNFPLFQKSFLFIKNIIVETHWNILCPVSLKQDSIALVICCIPATALIPSINKLLELLLYETEYFALCLIPKPEGRNIFAQSFSTDVSKLDSI